MPREYLIPLLIHIYLQWQFNLLRLFLHGTTCTTVYSLTCLIQAFTAQGPCSHSSCRHARTVMRRTKNQKPLSKSFLPTIHPRLPAKNSSIYSLDLFNTSNVRSSYLI